MTDPIQTVGIVGAGFMGSGIAEAVARAGFEVSLHEPAEAPLASSRERLGASVAKAVEADKLSAREAQALQGRIEWTTALEALAPCQLVIEAVTEDPEVKTAVFRSLGELVAPEALIASNTSSIPIAQLAAATPHRERVLGLHFFSPAQVMRLVEVVVGIDTAPEAVERAEAFCERIGKTPIRTKDRSGFIVNMLLVPYLMAGVRMYEEGFAARDAIDEGMRLGCGHPMGPLELADFIGLDVLYAVCNSLYEEFKRPEYAPPPLLKRMVVSGHLGRKSGRGFYEYDAA
ncbi:MAG TPA: 3-hydroxybutyryl-CoA dehydrogenase [Solirubrobacterales bacterium]|jgi:3-hydroxybutyryl-CoA dehydrogenase|nr:3-hydroxybutyryl-CoA dehydrogenase [Solirubrobacterales bacterium]